METDKHPDEGILRAAFPAGFLQEVNSRGRRILKGGADDGYWFHAKEYEDGTYFVMVGQKFIDSGCVEMGTFHREDLRAENRKQQAEYRKRSAQ